MSGAALRRLAVCVDDFGIHAPSDRAILELAKAGRISAVSVLVHGPDVLHHAATLRELAHGAPQCAVGLHLNLTERFQAQQYCQPLKSLIVRSHCRQLDEPAIRQTIAQQLDAFEALYHAPPDYVDGHEHVHAFPGVRRLLLSELSRRYPVLPVLRVPAAASWQGGKAWIIAALGGYGLKRQLHATSGAAFNRDFIGVYDFSTVQPYAQRVEGWLSHVGDLALLMTHPGLHPDSVYGAAARRMELAYLQSEAWPAALAAQAIRLVPFKQAEFKTRGHSV